MSNVGVLNPGFLPTVVGPVGSTTVTIAATDTACFTPGAALIAPYNGLWALVVDVAGVVTEPAATGTTLIFKLKTAAGVTLDTYTVEPTYLVNSGILYVAFRLVSPASASLYWPAGNIASVTGVSATHNATLSADARAVYSFAYVGD